MINILSKTKSEARKDCELLDGAELIVLEGLFAVLLEQNGVDKLAEEGVRPGSAITAHQ